MLLGREGEDPVSINTTIDVQQESNTFFVSAESGGNFKGALK